MKTFTDRIAGAILEQPELIPNLTVIVPSQRMISYLQRSLFTADNQPKMSPKIVTIDRWMQEMVDEPLIDRSRLLFELYRIFSLNPTEHEGNTFDSFLIWGQMLLSDFDEIDRYLVVPSQLFKNLRDVKELENWSFNSEELSKGQQRFMEFWDKLGPYYYELTEILEKKAQTTGGKIYRKVAENIDLAFQSDKNAHFIFAGFNALSKSEMTIMKQLFVMGRAKIFLDADASYLNDRFHEAGSFQRALLEFLQVRELPFVEDRLMTKSCEVQIIECAQNTGQAKVVGTILAGLSADELSETLLLLADEQLIVPVIQQLPKSIEKANITLGLPLRGTSMKLWVDIIFRFQEGFARRNSKSLYHKDVIQFLHHPFVLGMLTSEESKALRDLERDIIDRNRLFIQPEKLHLSKRLKELTGLLTDPWNENWLEGVKRIQKMNFLLDNALGTSNLLEKAIIRSFSEEVTSFENLLAEGYPVMQIRSFKALFNQHWSTAAMAYFGNPMEGLQIMGLLETRGLDFKKVIVIGLNEGTMPPTNPIQTLIPMDLRHYFGMPGQREKQGLFAHHFYRLLHAAEQLTITYFSGQDSIGTGEPSRFIQQIELELSALNRGFKITKNYFALGNQERVERHEEQKTPEILARLDEMLADGISYSKLDAFIKCPLNFYYRYVLRLGEENKVEEELEAGTLGTIIHAVLEDLFRPFAEENTEEGAKNFPFVTVEHLRKMQDDAPLLVDRKFQHFYSEDPGIYETGMNHVNYVIAKDIVQKILAKEIADLANDPEGTLYIQALEKELEMRTTVEINGVIKPLRINGVLDRIDRKNGITRVIDYKSGALKTENVEVPNTKTESVEAILKAAYGPKKSHVLQLLTYALLFREHYGKDLELSGIFSFINVSASPFALTFKEEVPLNERPQMVLEVITRILHDMYDTEKPFVHNPDAQYCAFCS